MTTNDLRDRSESELVAHETILSDGRPDESPANRADHRQPIIGMPLLVGHHQQGLQLFADAIGAWSIECMRARLLLLPLWPFPLDQKAYQSLWPVVASLDGLFLPAWSGDTDWHALWQAGENAPGTEYWSLCWEVALAQLATFLGMPILALADGAEQWNSALGGTRGIRSDQPQNEPPPPDNWNRHTIRVRAESTLAASLRPVTAQHEGEHQPWELAFLPSQHVERLAPGLRISAQSEEGKPAAFERRDGTFGIGILGRPDWEGDHPYNKAIFEAFLQASCAFGHERQQHACWEEAREQICATVSERVAQGQPLLATSSPTLKEDVQSTHPLTSPPRLMRQRSYSLTKEELNLRRRQRLKGRAW